MARELHGSTCTKEEGQKILEKFKEEQRNFAIFSIIGNINQTDAAKFLKIAQPELSKFKNYLLKEMEILKEGVIDSTKLHESQTKLFEKVAYYLNLEHQKGNLSDEEKEELLKAIDELRFENNALRNNIKSLQEELSSKEKENERLQKEIKDLRKENSFLREIRAIYRKLFKEEDVA